MNCEESIRELEQELRELKDAKIVANCSGNATNGATEQKTRTQLEIPAYAQRSDTLERGKSELCELSEQL